MSMQFCYECDKLIDTDLEYDHFVGKNFNICQKYLESLEEITSDSYYFYLETSNEPIHKRKPVIVMFRDFELVEETDAGWEHYWNVFLEDYHRSIKEDFKEKL